MNQLRLALQGIRGNAIRSLLSVLTLSASVVGVVTVASAAVTVESSVTQRALLVGGYPNTFQLAVRPGEIGLRDAQDVRALVGAALDAPAPATVIASLDASALEVAGVSTALSVEFVDAHLVQVLPFQLAEGRWIDSARSPAAGVVVNRATVTALGLALGDPVTVRTAGVTTDLPAVVVGVVEDGSFDPRAYVSLDDAAVFLAGNQDRLVTNILVTSPVSDEQAVAERLGRLDEVRGVAEKWSVQQIDTVRRLKAEVGATRSAFFVLGLMSLLAGVLAMANIGLSGMRERSAEHSLRRVIGAPRWHIAMVLLIESQLIALVSSALAIAVSFVLYAPIAQQFGAPFGVAPPPYPWSLAVIALVVGAVAALIGSAIPAINAFRAPLVRITRV